MSLLVLCFVLGSALRLHEDKSSLIAIDASINIIEKHGCSKEVSMNQSVQAKTK